MARITILCNECSTAERLYSYQGPLEDLGALVINAKLNPDDYDTGLVEADVDSITQFRGALLNSGLVDKFNIIKVQNNAPQAPRRWFNPKTQPRPELIVEPQPTQPLNKSQQIRALAAQGKSVSDVRIEVGCSYQMAYQIMKKAGFINRKNKISS